MATTALSLLAERWLDEVILQGVIDDVAGASISEDWTLPAGLGSIAILSVQATIQAIATVPVAATVPRGARFTVVNAAGTLVDVIGTTEWFATSGLGATFTDLACFIDPDALVYCQQDEKIRIIAPELDANAAPTGDLRIHVKAVRVRPLEGTAQGPIRLVR